MSCTEILNIVGDVASIITVVGGIYGLCKWIKSREAKIKVGGYKQEESNIYQLYLRNDGLCEATNVKIWGKDIETAAVIPNLKPEAEGQLGFGYRKSLSTLPITIYWTDKMGSHKKRTKLTPPMLKR